MRSQPWPRSWNANSSIRHRLRRRQRLEARVAVEQVRERRVERDARPSRAPPRRPRCPRSPRTRSTTPPPALRLSRNLSARPTSDGRSACQRSPRRARPAPSRRRARAARPRVRSTSPTASRQSNCASSAVDMKPLALGAAARGQVRADARRRAHPRRRQQHRHAALARAAASARAGRTTSSSVSSSTSLGSSSSNSIPPSAAAARARSSCAARSPYGSPSRTNSKPSLPCQSSDAGRLSVGSSAACSHSSSASASLPGRSSRCRPSSQRRLLHLVEAGVDPAREAPLERRVGRARRQVGLGRGERRAGTRRAPASGRAGRRRQPHAGGEQAVARDLVDEVRVELVERRRCGRRRGGGDRVELAPAAPSSSVAPQNAYQVLPPRVSCGCTSPSATARCARSTQREHRAALSRRAAASVVAARSARRRSRRRATACEPATWISVREPTARPSSVRTPSSERTTAYGASCCQMSSRVDTNPPE